MKRKLLILCIILSFCFNVPNVIYANDIDFKGTNTNAVCVNEYENLLEQIEQNKLKKSSYDEYKELLDLKKEYIETIYSYKKFSYDELKNKHFSDEQIQAILNFDGSDEMATKAAASVWVAPSTINRLNNIHGVRFVWYWQGTPLFPGPKNLVGVRWRSSNTSGNTVNTTVYSTESYVLYGSTSRKTAPTKIDNYNRVVTSEINMNGNAGWAERGAIDVNVRPASGTSTNLGNTIFKFTYASVKLNFSISYPPSISLDFDITNGNIVATKEYQVY